MQKGQADRPVLQNGAQGGTRTPTDYSTRPSNVRGYQLRHLSNTEKNYWFDGAAFAGASVVFAGAAFAGAAFASDAAGATSAGAGAGSSADVVERTDTPP